jgi:cytoskeletal protein RodZ
MPVLALTAGVAAGVLLGVGLLWWQLFHSDDTTEGIASLF